MSCSQVVARTHTAREAWAACGLEGEGEKAIQNIRTRARRVLKKRAAAAAAGAAGTTAAPQTPMPPALPSTSKRKAAPAAPPTRPTASKKAKKALLPAGKRLQPDHARVGSRVRWVRWYSRVLVV